MKLAHEIVSIFHSPDEAEAARKRWDEVFRGGSGIPDDIPEEVLAAPERVLDILRRLEMVSSGGEAKRLMKGGGIRLNEEQVTDPQAEVTLDMLPAVLQVGKRKFVRLVSPLIFRTAAPLISLALTRCKASLAASRSYISTLL